MSKSMAAAIIGLVITATVIYWIGAVCQVTLLFALMVSSNANLFASVAMAVAAFVQVSVVWHYVSNWLIAKMKKLTSKE